VAALGFLARFHELPEGADAKDDEAAVVTIAKAFAAREVSMRSFLDEHWPGKPGDAGHGKRMQVALLVDGVRFRKARLRGGRMQDPALVITQCSEDQVAAILRKREMLQRSHSRREERYCKRVVAAEPFVSYHRFARIFTSEEVTTMNLSRPAGDQLERTTSGLLRQHCCYTDCPSYLVNQGSRRKLMKHFALDMEITKGYFPSFHAITVSLLIGNRRKADFSHFLEKVENAVASDPRLRRWRNAKVMEGVPSFREAVADVWDQRERLQCQPDPAQARD